MSDSLFGGASTRLLEVSKQLTKIQTTLDALMERLQSQSISPISHAEMQKITSKAAQETAHALQIVNSLETSTHESIAQDAALAWWKARKNSK